MRILILGVGDAFTRKHHGSSAVVETPAGGFVLIDCPDLIHRALHQASTVSGWNIDPSRIDDVIVTHLHGDHCNGLEAFGFHRRLLRMRDAAAARPRLHVTRAVADRLWERLAPAMDPPMGSDTRPSTLADYFDVKILDPKSMAAVAGLRVECRVTRHPVPTIGLRLSDGLRTLGWSGDTAFDRSHIDWLSSADVIVHECNLGPFHSHVEELNALPVAIKGKMRLIHLPDDFDPHSTEIAILREGDKIEW